MKTKKLNIKDPKPGIYFDVSFDDYIDIDAVNNSTLKMLVDLSPAHCKHYIEHGRPETKALAFGSLADCYILEPLRFYDKYIVGPEEHKNTKIWKQFVADNPNKEAIKQADLDACIAIYNKISVSPSMRLLSGGFSQTVCLWIDEPTGLLCKSRQDYLNLNICLITDLKTTQSSNPFWFSKDIYKYKYHTQAAFYIDGMMIATKEPEWAFAFFCVEKVEPFVNSAFQLGEKSIEAGRVMYRKALDKYADCLKTGQWPPYQEEITMIEIPAWELDKLGMGKHNQF